MHWYNGSAATDSDDRPVKCPILIKGGKRNGNRCVMTRKRQNLCCFLQKCSHTSIFPKAPVETAAAVHRIGRTLSTSNKVNPCTNLRHSFSFDPLNENRGTGLNL